jgi:hypothetical protein
MRIAMQVAGKYTYFSKIRSQKSNVSAYLQIDDE